MLFYLTFLILTFDIVISVRETFSIYNSLRFLFVFLLEKNLVGKYLHSFYLMIKYVNAEDMEGRASH